MRHECRPCPCVSVLCVQVFLPSTGLLLGTLTALTIGTLQQRQLDIRRSLQVSQPLRTPAC